MCSRIAMSCSATSRSPASQAKWNVINTQSVSRRWLCGLASWSGTASLITITTVRARQLIAYWGWLRIRPNITHKPKRRSIRKASGKVNLCGHRDAAVKRLKSLTPPATIGGTICGHPAGIADCISSGALRGCEPPSVTDCLSMYSGSHPRCDNLLHVSSGYPRCVRPTRSPGAKPQTSSPTVSAVPAIS
jgi:hypothetical protein